MIVIQESQVKMLSCLILAPTLCLLHEAGLRKRSPTTFYALSVSRQDCHPVNRVPVEATRLPAFFSSLCIGVYTGPGHQIASGFLYLPYEGTLSFRNLKNGMRSFGVPTPSESPCGCDHGLSLQQNGCSSESPFNPGSHSIGKPGVEGRELTPHTHLRPSHSPGPDSQPSAPQDDLGRSEVGGSKPINGIRQDCRPLL